MVLRTAWPIVVSRLSYVLMGVVDTLLVAQLGTTETAAVGLGVIATFTVFCFGFGVLNAVKVVTAQAVGAEQPDLSRRTLSQGIALGAGMAALMMVLLPFFDVVQLVGGRGAIGTLGAQYFDIRLLAVIPLFVGNAIFSHLEGTGDTRTPMRAAVMANALNVVLTVALVFGVGPFPAMGAAGAAVGTAIASAAMGVAALVIAIRRYGRLSADMRGMGRLVQLGVPMGVEFFVDELAWLMFAAFVTAAGKPQLAAHVIVSRVICLSLLPGHGVGAAAMILVGQAVGREDRLGAWQVQQRAMRLAFAAMGSVALVFAFFSGPLLSVFTADPAVVEIGTILLLVAVGLQLVESVVLVRTGALQGAGDTMFVMVANIVAAWGLLVPAAFVATTEAGAVGGWLVRLVVLLGLAAAIEARARVVFGVQQGEQLGHEPADVLEINADVLPAAVQSDERVGVAAAGRVDNMRRDAERLALVALQS